MTNLERLKEVWDAVKAEFKDGVINSERCMQAVMYHHLKVALAGSGSLVYVEPTMRLAGSDNKAYKPDLVVCSHGKVDMLIELKYNPNGYSEYRGDIEKLGRFADLTVRQSFDLIRPYMATSHLGEYVVSEGTQLVFAVIAKFDSVAVDICDVAAAMPEMLRKQFVHLCCKITPSKIEDSDWKVACAGAYV